jgi:DNA mismatch endonuclease (patch repair protein)
MSKIRGKNTGPEVALRRALWAGGLRYRLGTKLPGRPDLTFPSARVVVFVDGCFWHACPAHATRPKTNAAFWTSKIGRNVERDREVTSLLVKDGWLVLRFWEHEVEKALPSVVERVRKKLAGRGRLARSADRLRS